LQSNKLATKLTKLANDIARLEELTWDQR